MVEIGTSRIYLNITSEHQSEIKKLSIKNVIKYTLFKAY